MTFLGRRMMYELAIRSQNHASEILDFVCTRRFTIRVPPVMRLCKYKPHKLGFMDILASIVLGLPSVAHCGRGRT